MATSSCIYFSLLSTFATCKLHGIYLPHYYKRFGRVTRHDRITTTCFSGPTISYVSIALPEGNRSPIYVHNAFTIKLTILSTERQINAIFPYVVYIYYPHSFLIMMHSVRIMQPIGRWLQFQLPLFSFATRKHRLSKNDTSRTRRTVLQ